MGARIPHRLQGSCIGGNLETAVSADEYYAAPRLRLPPRGEALTTVKKLIIILIPQKFHE